MTKSGRNRVKQTTKQVLSHRHQAEIELRHKKCMKCKLSTAGNKFEREIIYARTGQVIDQETKQMWGDIDAALGR